MNEKKNIGMNNLSKYLIAFLIITMISPAFAGNKDRSGQAGASELLINPWARSSGWGGANMAKVRGLEAMWGNVAGTAFTRNTEINFSSTQWLKGTGTSIFAFGLTQKIGESGVIGIQIMSMSFGEIQVTTGSSPDGGLGTYKPSLMNFAISYAKAFSNSIYGGIVIKGVSESISDVNAFGIAIDAGIQYVTGENDQVAFGVALKNVGPQMKFSGDGLSFKDIIQMQGVDQGYTFNQRSQGYEMPTMLTIGASYDFLFGGDYTLTTAGTFISNSFSKDQFSFGLQMNMKNYVMLRAGYTYEEGIFENIENSEKSNLSSGLSLGATVQVPINKEKGTNFAIDYSYRESVSFNGNHSIGIVLNF